MSSPFNLQLAFVTSPREAQAQFARKLAASVRVGQDSLNSDAMHVLLASTALRKAVQVRQISNLSKLIAPSYKNVCLSEIQLANSIFARFEHCQY